MATLNKKGLSPSPLLEAAVFQKLFFTWLNPLFSTGSQKNLEYEDLFEALPDDTAKALGERINYEWQEELKSCQNRPNPPKQKKGALLQGKLESEADGDCSKPKPKPSLLKALTRMFGRSWAAIGILLFIEECLAKIAQPLFLGYLLRYFSGEFSDQTGYLLATGVIISVMYYTISHHPSFFSVVHLNMKIRIACSALLYSKTLKLSQSALTQTTIGQIVNLLSNDVARFDFCLNFLHYLWIGPVQLLISVWILWTYYGPSCLSGVIFLLLFTPFQSFMGHLFSKLRLTVAVRTDGRVRIMNEIVNGIRVIKMYAWEIPFSKMVADSREDEIKSISKQMVLRAMNLGLYYVSSKLIIFLTLLTYVLTGNLLTAEKVFVAMALYQNVRLLMTIFFPWGISLLAETKVCIKRIEDFLSLDEYIPGSASKIGSDKPLVVLDNVHAKWTGSPEDTLSDLSLSASDGKLITIVGPVGCGKSSLLQVILHELPISAGSLKVSGSIAYVGQEPWVFNASVRDNIIFGKDYIPSRYQRVVDACALRQDFATLSYGDKTIVGDKGLSLSGGQKARINLARAVYSDASIILLDDPLSAVDSEVGRHLFEKCICGFLKDKIRILVTHQLQYLPKSDEIIILAGGLVHAQGSFTTLKKQNVNFAQMMGDSDNEEMADKEEEDAVSLPEQRSRAGTLSRSRASSLTTSNRELHKLRLRKTSVLSYDEKLIEKEAEEVTSTGSISWRTYIKYLRAGTNLFCLGFILLSNLITQVIYSGSDFWLQFWITMERKVSFVEENDIFNETENYSSKEIFPQNVTGTNETTFFSSSMEDEKAGRGISRNQLICVYTILMVSLFIMTLVRTIGFFKICMNSSIALHLQLFYGVLRAPMHFFEVNPVGRILNRFSKDIATIDELLPVTLFDTVEVGLQVLGVIVVISIINPIFLLPSAVIALLFYFIRNYYQKTARSLKRLEGNARSPVFTHLSTSLGGLTTIRAFRAQHQFQSQFNEHLDLHTAIFYLFNASARWLGLVVDWISILYIAAVTFGVVALKLDAASAGLAISSAMSLTSWFQWGVRQSCEAENQFVSVERVNAYAEIESEAPLESFPERQPPPNWPSKGEIEMQHLYVRYKEGDQPFLKDICCTFLPLEKVGIIGRTGAGKTSLISALFRLTEPSAGSITIDGVNVLQLGLHDLRSKISIIPQDPILFLGSLRRNLDPLEEYSDPEIWEVLKDVHLFETVQELPFGLDSCVSESGSNLSVGQRQLICMGRAILRKNKIIVLDEATANVDPVTDVLIQNTIREKFENCTVLTVAHRLLTVIDSDRIMVLDGGRIVEFDEPYKLLQNPTSAFSHLVMETGPDTAFELTRIARNKAGVQGPES